MDATQSEDAAVARVASAIGEPARARMLFTLMDGHARTGTELAAAADVTASTASVHLSRLATEHLVSVEVQGKHRYYRLHNARVARVLESLSVLAGAARPKFVPNTPSRLRHARTCYDHIAGTLGVALHDSLAKNGWLRVHADEYVVTPKGAPAFAALGIDLDAVRAQRRRFAYACLDWSERRSHVGGALGAALLHLARERRWVEQDLDSRALELTRIGRREFAARLGLADDVLAR